MRSRLLPENSSNFRTSAGRWLRLLPSQGNYLLYDPIAESAAGRILIDAQGFWIYDGEHLSLAEQEEVAGHLLGYQREMDELLRDLC